VQDQDLYAKQLLLKGNGYPLWVPQPKRHFGDLSAPAGIAIGDVGIITADGGFDFLFNVCVSADHPINPRDLPSTFSPLSPQLSHTDICEFQEYAPGEYLASTSVERVSSIKYKSNQLVRLFQVLMVCLLVDLRLIALVLRALSWFCLMAPIIEISFTVPLPASETMDCEMHRPGIGTLLKPMVTLKMETCIWLLGLTEPHHVD